MLREQQPVIPNLNLAPPPNPNPNPPHTNASHFTYSHGLESISEINTYQHTGKRKWFFLFRLTGEGEYFYSRLRCLTELSRDRFRPFPCASGTTSEAIQMPTVMHSAGNFGVVTQPVANNVILPTQPVNILPFQCEVCNIACDTRDVLEKHKVGKKHVKNMKKLASSSSIAPEMAPQPPVVAGSTSIAPEMAPQQPPVASSSSIAPEMAPQQPPVVASSTSIAPEMAPQQPPVVASSSSIAPEMEPQQPPVVGSETSVGELENKKHNLLQNGASVDTLIYCHICNVVCNNQDVYQSHVAGKRHSAKAAIQLAFSNGTSNTEAECSSQAQPYNDGSQKKPDTLLLWCELCKISCTSNELLNLHLAGKKHLKNLKRSEQTPDLSLTMEYSEKLEKPIEPNPTVTTEPNEKRAGSHEDVQTKKQKVVQGGGVSDAASTTCTMCNVVCNSPTDFRAHLAGKKHIVTAARQAEAQTTGQAK